MSQNDFVIDNGTGLAVRQDIESAFQALASNNSGSSTPSTTYAYQFWADTSAGTLKIRNSANNAWIELLQLDGTLTLEDGSASAPALGFRDDLDTGIFSSGANIFNIATSGTERFRVDSSGQVGINDTSPDAELAVAAVSGNAPHIDIGQAGGARFKLGYEGNNCFLGGSSSTAMFIFKNSVTSSGHPQASGTERMRLDGSGRFFVGTTTTSLGSSAVFGEICLRGGTEGAGIHMADNDANVHAGFFTSDNSNFFVIRTITNHPMTFRTNNTERFRIDTSGNLNFSMEASSSYPTQQIKWSNDSTTTNGFYIAQHSDRNGRIWHEQGLDLVFGTNNTERMRMNTSGQLCIGTTSGVKLLTIDTGTGSDGIRLKSDEVNLSILTSNTGDTLGRCIAFNASRQDSGSLPNLVLGGQGGLTLNVDVNTTRMTVDSSGNIGAPSGTNIFNASDSRLKTNIVDLDKGLAEINKLRPVSFNWIDGFCDVEKDKLYGFIAQEVQTLDSNLIQDFSSEVTLNPDTENETKISDVLRVNEKFIIPMLVKAVQELSAKVAALEAA